MRHKVMQRVREGLDVQERFFRANTDLITTLADRIVQVLRKDGKILLFGNGGSAADAQHIAAEFVNRYLIDRPALPALALTTDTSILTSVSNDDHFAHAFSRQIEALGHQGDIAWGLSTSGSSENVIRALRTAHQMGLLTVVFTGKTGGEAGNIAEYALRVDSSATPRIQEVHMIAAHIICELVEMKLYGS